VGEVAGGQSLAKFMLLSWCTLYFEDAPYPYGAAQPYTWMVWIRGQPHGRLGHSCGTLHWGWGWGVSTLGVRRHSETIMTKKASSGPDFSYPVSNGKNG